MQKLINLLAFFQAFLFLVLYSVWNLPGTNFLSDLCLIAGALITLIILYKFRIKLFNKNLLPIWVLFAIFIYAFVHLWVWSNDLSHQLKELGSIWKRVLIAYFFAIGLGIAYCKTDKKLKILNIIFIGLLIPVLIFYLKFGIKFLSEVYNFDIPSYLVIHEIRNSRFYIAKPEITFFYFPVVIFSYTRLFYLFFNESKKYSLYLFYISTIILVTLIFYINNIKNGILYSQITFLVFFIYILYLIFFGKKIPKILVINLRKNLGAIFAVFVLFIILGMISVQHIRSNQTWYYLVQDIKVGQQIYKYDKWKSLNNDYILLNESNVPVSNTTYYRSAWLITGSHLLVENPMGYGLLEHSFSHLAKRKWDQTNLVQTHNAWLDFALAMGFPGLILLLFANILAQISGWKINHAGNFDVTRCSTQFTLMILSTLWLTSEVDFKYSLPAMFFWIAFLSTLNMRNFEID